jgi:hypothetical protein
METKPCILGFDRCFVPALVKNRQTYIRGYVLDDEACSKMLLTVKLASVILTDIICTIFLVLPISKVGFTWVLLNRFNEYYVS